MQQLETEDDLVSSVAALHVPQRCCGVVEAEPPVNDPRNGIAYVLAIAAQGSVPLGGA